MNSRQRIMVVDQEKDTHQLLNNTLETEGFDTIFVANSATALMQLHQVMFLLNYDILLHCLEELFAPLYDW